MSLIVFEERISDSPFVERVWQSRSERAGEFTSIAACTWEIVVSRYQGASSLIVRGPETMATPAFCPAEGEWFGIRFKAGTYMPHFLPASLRDHNNVILPNAASRSFWLDASAWDLPSFDNAETFVGRLISRGLLAKDPLITADAVEEIRDVSARTFQRRFLRIAGMTYSRKIQIERARRAALLLRQGSSILDAVFEVGYYDQAHLTRSLKHFIGQTPAEVIRNQKQLSFLYNTDAA
jgi:AraC-like DNA-binding protein